MFTNLINFLKCFKIRHLVLEPPYLNAKFWISGIAMIMWNKTLSSSYMFQWKLIWTEYFAEFLIDIQSLAIYEGSLLRMLVFPNAGQEEWTR